MSNETRLTRLVNSLNLIDWSTKYQVFKYSEQELCSLLFAVLLVVVRVLH